MHPHLLIGHLINNKRGPDFHFPLRSANAISKSLHHLIHNITDPETAGVVLYNVSARRCFPITRLFETVNATTTPPAMGRVKESAAEAVNAVIDGAASPAYTALSGRAESIKHGTLALSPRRARLPGPARFALAVVLSFALSSLGRSFVDQCSNNEVGSITREANSQTELFVLAAWRLYVLTRRPSSSQCGLFRPPFQLRAEEADPLSARRS